MKQKWWVQERGWANSWRASSTSDLILALTSDIVVLMVVLAATVADFTSAMPCVWVSAISFFMSASNDLKAPD